MNPRMKAGFCMKSVLYLFFTVVLISSCSKDSSTEPDVQDQFTVSESVITIEAEDIPLADGWVVENRVVGYSGSGYIRWDGADNFTEPGIGLLQKTVAIKRPGIYRFQWHTKVGRGTNSTEANDSWLKFPDAKEFYGKKFKNGEASYIYPRGSGKTPEPEGAGKNGWFKVYLSGTINWTWSSNVSDNDAHAIFVEFERAGDYLMQISARSTYHCIDRIVLYHNSLSEGTVMRMMQGM